MGFASSTASTLIISSSTGFSITLGCSIFSFSIFFTGISSAISDLDLDLSEINIDETIIASNKTEPNTIMFSIVKYALKSNGTPSIKPIAIVIILSATGIIASIKAFANTPDFLK